MSGFSPSLFVGATPGAAWSSIVGIIERGAPLRAPAFAMAGRGAMLGGSTGTAMTAVEMIFEMTGNQDIVLPITIAVALSLGAQAATSATAPAVADAFSFALLASLMLMRHAAPTPANSRQTLAPHGCAEYAARLARRDCRISTCGCRK